MDKVRRMFDMQPHTGGKALYAEVDLNNHFHRNRLIDLTRFIKIAMECTEKVASDDALKCKIVMQIRFR